MKLSLALLLLTTLGLYAEDAATDVKSEHAKAAEEAVEEVMEETEKAESKVDTIETESGLKYFDYVVGEGESPVKGKEVTVHYTGWLEDGTKFDSSVDRGQPFSFTLGIGRVIKGWDEGVATMKVGGKRQLIIPPELGYGDREVGGGLIPANSTLIFDVELLDVQK
jgi:peptidylprolyl isomerase